MPKAAARFQPFAPKAVQADGAVTSLSLRELASQTLGLAVRACGTTRSVTFPSPTAAPYADVSAADTWTSFVLGTEATEQHIDTFHYPWYHQESQAAIIVEVRFATVHFLPLKLRAYTDELPGLAALATTNSDAASLRFASDEVAQDAWSRESFGTNTRVKAVRLTAQISSPTVPANRYLGIFPQVAVPSSLSPLISISGTYRVYIEAMQIYDIPDLRTYGNG